MKVLSRLFNVDGRNGEIQVDIYGDTHLGSMSVDERLLREHIKETQETGRYWVHLGDAIDGIIPGDRRWNHNNVADWAWRELKRNRIIAAEWDRFYELFSPIKDNGLFVLDGDGKHDQYGDIDDCMQRALAALGIPYGDVACVYRFIFRRSKTCAKKIDLAFHHGWFAGRTNSNKALNLERALGRFPDAVAFFCGHGHTKAITSPIVGMMVEGNYVAEVVRRAAMTGGYLKTYAKDTVGYAEKKGYPPVALGRITVTLRPFHRLAEKRVEITNI